MKHDQLVPRGRKSLTLQEFYLQLADAPVGRRGQSGGTVCAFVDCGRVRPSVAAPGPDALAPSKR